MVTENMQTARTAVRGSGARVVALLAHTVVGFLLMPFLVHSLGDRIYGYWVLVGTVVGYYGLFDLGIVSAVQFYVAKAVGEGDPAEANRVISTAFFAFAALGSFVALLTVGVALLSRLFIVSPSDISLFRTVLLIMGLGLAVGFPARACVGALSAHLRWDIISWVSVGILLLRTGLIVFAIKAGWGLVGLAAVTQFGELVMYVVYYRALKGIQHQFRLSLALVTLPSFKEVLRYSGFTLIIKVSNQLRLYIGALLVGAILSAAAVTHYAIASRLALSYRDLMIAVFGILSPVFSRLLGSRQHKEIKRVFTLATTLSTATGGFIACGMVLYGRVFIEFWMGKNYVDAYWPLVFLTGAIFFEISQLPSVAYMYGVSKHPFLAYTTLLEGSAILALSLYLGRRYGMEGVALGALIPMSLMWFLIQPMYVCAHMGIPKRFFYVRLFGRSVAGAVLVTVVPYLLFFSRFTKPTGPSLAIAIGLQALIASAAFVFLLLNRDERWTLLEIVRRAAPGKGAGRRIQGQADLESII